MKLLFLYPGQGRAERRAGLADGSTPREFFYGLDAAEAAGHEVRIGDTRRDPDGLLARLRLGGEIARNRVMRYGTSAERVRALAGELQWADMALAFTDGFSISLGLHARPVAPGTRLVGGFHGISTFTERTPAPLRPLAHARTRRALRGLDHLFFFGATDRRYAIETYGLDEAQTSLFRFGIDTAFWTPDPAADGADGVVFSAGTDPARDYATLLAAGLATPLRILTRLTLPPHGGQDVEVISGSFHGTAITDAVLRDIYRRALAVVVPLHDVLQPTGYSVTLQAMACGKPVVLSDIRGLWDREVFVSGENCILVSHGDPAALREAVERLTSDAELRARIGAGARATAERAFPLTRMDASIRDLITRATPAGMAP